MGLVAHCIGMHMSGRYRRIAYSLKFWDLSHSNSSSIFSEMAPINLPPTAAWSFIRSDLPARFSLHSRTASEQTIAIIHGRPLCLCPRARVDVWHGKTYAQAIKNIFPSNDRANPSAGNGAEPIRRSAMKFFHREKIAGRMFSSNRAWNFYGRVLCGERLLRRRHLYATT